MPNLQTRTQLAQQVINMKRSVPVKELSGTKKTIPQGEALTAYPLKGGNVLLKDGDEYIVNKGQFQNILGNAIGGEAKEFAPELKQIEEKVLGIHPNKTAIIHEINQLSKRREELNKIISPYLAKSEDVPSLIRDEWTELHERREQLEKSIESNPTKFSQYIKPTGQNYREILLKAKPEEDTEKQMNDYADTLQKKYNIPGERALMAYHKFIDYGEQAKLETLMNKHYNKPVFKSSHYPDEPNLLAHLLMEDHTHPKTKKGVTFIDELQSDWALEGRKQGFADPGAIKVIPRLERVIGGKPDWYYIDTPDKRIQGIGERKYEVIKALDQRQAEEFAQKRGQKLAGGQFYANGGEPYDFKENYIKHDATKNDITKYDVIDAKGKKSSFELKTSAENFADDLRKRGVPSHPLLKNWTELALKRALKEAVDTNKDYLSWSSGDQVKNRYNLAKYVDKIHWEREDSQRSNDLGGLKHVKIDIKNGSQMHVVTLNNGEITDISQSTPEDWKGKNIAEAIGKSIGEKIVKDKNGDLSNDDVKDLSIGGNWANNLYDREVPNILKKLTGQGVEKLDLGLAKDKQNLKWYKAKIGDENRVSYGDELKPEHLKKDLPIINYDGNTNHAYYITDVLKDGKFNAIPTTRIFHHKTTGPHGSSGELIDKNGVKQYYYPSDTEEHNVEQEGETQQALKITPQVKALVQGKPLPLNQPSGVTPVSPAFQLREQYTPESVSQAKSMRGLE